MKSDWRHSTWGDEVSLEYGKAIRGYNESTGQYRVFGSNGPIGWWETPLTTGPGVILGRKGAYRGVEYSKESFFVIDTAYYVAPKSDLDMRWLYYAIKYHKLGEIDDGSPIPSTTRAAVYVRELDIPPLDVQREMAKILGAMDDKIELNCQINQTLEQIAQTIFKSWFVDFEPVKAKQHLRTLDGNDEQTERAAQAIIAGAVNLDVITTATDLSALDQQLTEALSEKLAHQTAAQREQLVTTASHFPDQLVDSELGLIPEDWDVVTLGEVVKILDSKRIPLSKKQRLERQGLYPYYGAAALMDYVDDFLFEGPHVLMAEDGSVIDDAGYPVTQYVWGRFWVNNHAHILKGAGGVCDEQILLFLKGTPISQYVTGAVQLKVNQKNMKSIPFVKAASEINDDFARVIAPLYSGFRVRADENLLLSNARGALLPKLLSGELVVAE